MEQNLANAGIYLVQSFFGIYMILLMVRLLMQISRADYYNPICQGIVRVTDPAIMPFRKMLPTVKGVDLATLAVAFVVQLVAVVLIEAIRRLGRIEPGAAMGVVFTALFAGGVLLLEQSDTSRVHLDVDHALMGNLETLIWLRASGWDSVIDPVALSHLPPELPRIAVVAALMAALTVIFWRPLKLATFDEGFARAIGLPVSAIGLALVIAAAVAAVAAFDAVGSIIVIAMFICPPATARLMTDRLATQVWLSLAIAALSAILGYVLAGYGPIWLGFDSAVSAAGMIATVSGVMLAIACLWGRARGRVAPVA